MTAECDKWRDAALRAHADMENLRKRTQQDIEKTVNFANTSFAKDLLPVLDCLNGAIQCAPKNSEDKVWNNVLKGIEMTVKQFHTVFKEHHIQEMDCLGKVFDPNFQKVVQEVEDKDKEAGTIVQILQNGYTIHDRVLREAMVVVSKK